MSGRVECMRSLAVPGPLALEAMLDILGSAARHEAPYANVTLSLGLEQIRVSTPGEIAIPISLDADPQPQRYSCDVTIRAMSAAGFFPRFRGSISVSPLRDSGSELWLQGEYAVPLGSLGNVVDETLLNGVARASLDRVLGWLGDEIASQVQHDQQLDIRNR
jgi:hypothetical protein